MSTPFPQSNDERLLAIVAGMTGDVMTAMRVAGLLDLTGDLRSVRAGLSQTLWYMAFGHVATEDGKKDVRQQFIEDLAAGLLERMLAVAPGNLLPHVPAACCRHGS